MFRRPFRRRTAYLLHPDVSPLFQRANELLGGGDYTGAAQAFENLARDAQARGLPRAGHLFLRAGRCHLLAGQILPGMADLKQGLTLLASRRDSSDVFAIGQRIITELEQTGFPAQAGEIRAWLNGAVPGSTGSPGPGSPPRRALLPTACPSCGGPLFSNEVDWVDETTAQCPYCGGGVRGEA